MKSKRPLPRSALEYILTALIPYSEANTKLVFKPHLFFNDLAKISKIREESLRIAYGRAESKGYLEVIRSGPVLTSFGKLSVERFVAKRLGNSALLMVIFDIPEEESWKRQHLRRLLRELNFDQVQKSVWVTDLDYRRVIDAEVKGLDIGNYVQVYEAVRL